MVLAISYSFKSLVLKLVYKLPRLIVFDAKLPLVLPIIPAALLLSVYISTFEITFETLLLKFPTIPPVLGNLVLITPVEYELLIYP